MDQTNLKKYISQNIIPVKPGRKCVDGRYLPQTEDSGRLARAGGDFGYSMALLALNKQKNLGLSVNDCFEKVKKALEKLNENYYFHTDHHADPEKNTLSIDKIGCGHAGKPMIEGLSEEYELDPEEERELVALVKQQFNDHAPGVMCVNLPGDHQEQAVLIVNSSNYTLNNFDGTTMFFLYDKTRDGEFVKKLVPELGISNITPQEFQSILDLQTNVTLHNLALGKEIYEVTIENPEKFEVKMVGKVE